jgi:UDP-N-acetylglucosamine 2-epimerase (non-hydrolysing)
VVVEGARKRVLVVVGTRPEAIKMAPVLEALRAHENVLESRLALTGQHSSLVDQVLETFGLEPAWDLGIMREGQTLYDVAEGCLSGLRNVVSEFSPDVLLVQGDTATVFFGSLVAFFERRLVGHVEAGLRSHDKWAPYPEEVFRRLTDVVTDFHFAPTRAAAANLIREGVAPDTVFVTGNTVVDALQTVAKSLPAPRNGAVASWMAHDGRRVLLTAHRRESFGEPIRRIFEAVRTWAERNPDVRILYPVHPNPNVRGPAGALLGDHPRIALTDPVDYFDLVGALEVVLTDSGGIQEEAPTFGVPVLVLRDVTERPEGVDAGVAELVGSDPERILDAADRALGRARDEVSHANPYGDGSAGVRIADIVRAALTGTPRATVDWSGP